jgi:CRISPR-associated endonuclease/helicase Cas3
MMPAHLQQEMDALYERIRHVFAPTSLQSAWSLRHFFKKYYHRKRWLQENEKQISMGGATAEQVADWIEWQKGVEYEPPDLEPHLPMLWERERDQRRLRDFVTGQVHLTESLFVFRDSFEGPKAVIFDKQHLFSSETINSYDLLHVLSNFCVRWLQGHREFVQAFGDTEHQGNLYGILEGWRKPRLIVELTYKSSWSRKQFDKRVCRRPIALQGLRLAVRERGGASYPLDPRIAGALADQWITVLGVTPNDSGVVFGKLKGTQLYSHRLTVHFLNGQTEEGYRILLGTQAFQAHAELLGYYWMKDRLETDAIII